MPGMGVDCSSELFLQIKNKTQKNNCSALLRTEQGKQKALFSYKSCKSRGMLPAPAKTKVKQSAR